MEQSILKGTSVVDWKVDNAPTNCTPKWVYIGRDEDKIGPIQIALAVFAGTPSKDALKTLHALRKGKSNIQLVVGGVAGETIWIFGPDEKTQVVDLPLEQGLRQLQSALDESNSLNAYTRLGQFRRSLDTTSLVGVTNSGLFASYHIRENVPKRGDWEASCDRAKPWLSLRADNLIKALGFQSEKTAGNALVLSSGTPKSKAIAILLDDSEQFDSSSPRHTGISPVAFGLNVATRQGVNWLFMLRKDQIRLYPAKDGVGVGQKGQVETYLEIDLAAIDTERAGLLALIFSAEALEPNGTTNELLDGSSKFASQLGLRLRERIYEHVVPQLSKSVAEQLRDQGSKLDSDGLTLAYRLTLRILFRLLFQAYAEDRGLLPAGRNEGYDANSLKTIAKRIIDTPVEKFGKSKTLWLDLVQVWNAIDEGNETWSVPAYNGGLFGTDLELHPEGAKIEKLGIQDDILGPVLQHLLIDISEDNVPGPVDFRSLSVREFGTIYEGLLESSLSVATENLTVDSKGAWLPATKGDDVLAKAGDVYFHSASGERKSTGSYFTPSVVVDHLIDRSLSPALDAHLLKIKKHLDNGDQAAAARDFFDFRVADLAMGSGHFLVAAVDRIEAKMRTFLAEKETQVPGVNAQLHRLAEAAKAALGKDESAIGEIEPAALLRRQIARRCIYGLDINPLAVELARLGLWIHTFVPGLPMSNLDHGLVCANSLTGIGTIDEALNQLSPDSAVALGKKGTGVAVSFFADGFKESLVRSKDLLIEVANSDEASKGEVIKSSQSASVARKAAEPALHIFNCALAARLGLIEIPAIYEESHLIELAKKKDIIEFIKGLMPAHMPYLFPEVFVRDNPGFDVLLGNPPWEELMLDERKFWLRISPGLLGKNPQDSQSTISNLRKQYPSLLEEFAVETEQIANIRKIILSGPYPGLGTGDVDLYQAFTWRNWQLLRDEGCFALVTPRSLLNGAGAAEWRNEVLSNSQTHITTVVNTNKWIFPSVHAQYSIILICSVKTTGKNKSLGLNGPFDNELNFIENVNNYGYLEVQELAAASTGMTIPQLPDTRSIEVFKKLRKSPRFDEYSDFNFKPVREFDATNDRSIFDSGQKSGPDNLKVVGGSSFNHWAFNTEDIFAWADKNIAIEHLQKKRLNQARISSSAFFNLNPKILTSSKTLPLYSSRIAFRQVTNSVDSRTVISMLIPPSNLLVNSAPYLLKVNGTVQDEAFLLAIFSSYSLDWYARRFIVLNLNFHILNGFPIPVVNKSDKKYKQILTLVASLIDLDGKNIEWVESLEVKFKKIESEEQKFDTLSELDALVCMCYGLDKNDVVHIFETFHKTWDYKKYLGKTLEFYEKWRENK